MPVDVYTMNEKLFAKQLAFLRKEQKMTQEELAGHLHVSSQAVSKWENGHSLPETALLPKLARILDTNIDNFFRNDNLVILEALYGDGIEYINVTKRLNRFIEKDVLNILVSPLLLGITASEDRFSFLTLKYQSSKGLCFAAFLEGEPVFLSGNDMPAVLPDRELCILAGRYGTKMYSYDIMRKIEHYKPFNWNAYHANHETFPSNPANDRSEYLTLVYLNNAGIYMATCAEGESLAYSDGKNRLIRQFQNEEYYISDVPQLPSFGEGMECSWAASLTVALQSMKIHTTYDEVMGVSGACYRLAFCSPNWDYSSVDGLVAYDYATPGFAAYGYMPEQHGHIEKADRTAHRKRITNEIRSGMPVLGINLRVAPEWGVICGYSRKGEDLFCRTKYDRWTIENNPVFMEGAPPFDPSTIGNPYQYLDVDNWPFLLCYFSEKCKVPTPKESLIKSLEIFIASVEKEQERGYFMGFKAYEVWACDLRDDLFYESCDDAQLARRFSVNQFCVLALLDARTSAFVYLENKEPLFHSEVLSEIGKFFKRSSRIAQSMHNLLDSGAKSAGVQTGEFWTSEKRHIQADALDQMASLEHKAYILALDFLSKIS